MEQKNVDDLQTWDLSYPSKQKANSDSERESEFMNYPVLDLSCKNLVTPTTTGTNTTACLSRSLPAHTSRQHQHSSLSDAEKLSPFASTAMLSPSSELNSPREMTEKCEPSFYSAGGKIDDSLPLLVPSPVATMGVPILYPSLPLNNGAIKIPVATSTITSTSTAYIGTPSSLQTNDETIKTTTLLMSEPSTHVGTLTPSFNMVKKTPRPFKAYTKDPFSVNRPGEIVDINPIINYESKMNFLQFREKMLHSIRNESAPNPKMRRISKSPGLPTSTADEKDAAYWERRKKNNEAAKRSRDARRAKEDDLAIWATFLQQENTQLKNQLTKMYYLLRKAGYNINQYQLL
ncbi:unnamed protein product [Lasius platythorax]|uniref:BZIP domain-containing protein n=1 Tax=Lasius platythorax TaxID=488582 RepID=A0AAV2N7T0_9HYME